MAKSIVSLVREEDPAPYVVTNQKYEIDEGLGVPIPLGIHNTPLLEYGAGNVRGAALGLDLVEWFAAFKKAALDNGISDRDVSHDRAADSIRALISDAQRVMDDDSNVGKPSRRGQANNLLQSICTLAVAALADSKHAKKDLERLLEIEVSSMREDAEKAAADAADLMKL